MSDEEINEELEAVLDAFIDFREAFFFVFGDDE